MNYTHHTVEAFSDALAALYAAPTSEAAIRTMLPSLERAFKSRYVVVDELPDQGVPVLHACTHAEEISSSLIHYPEHAHELPSVKFVRAGGIAPAYRLLDFATERQLGETTIYRELMRPVGLHDQIGLTVRLKASGLALTLNRDRRFDDDELFLASLLCPHLAAVLAGIRSEESGYTSRVGLNTESVAVTGAGGCKAELSRGAAALLDRYFPGHSSVRGQRGLSLPADLSRWICAHAARLLKSAPDCETIPPYRIIGPCGRLHLRLRLDRSQAGLLLWLTEDRGADDWFRLRERGLTPRECEVVFWVSQGKRDSEIAIILGAATKTIGKHVERILSKLGTENRFGAAIVGTDWLRDHPATPGDLQR